MIRTAAAGRPPGRTVHGRHVLMALLAFFGVVLAVNGYFLAAALSTHTGVVSAEPYRKGLAYNERIAADARQGALGWEGRLELIDGAVLQLTLQSRSQLPVEGRSVTVDVGRPTTAAFDRRLPLHEIAPGRYASQPTALEPGSWVANVDVRPSAGGEPELRMRKRLWLQR